MSGTGWRLERTYLAGAGLAESRLEGLDLRWSKPFDTGGHAVLWADNGTGKTMITALRYALYLPNSRDFVRGDSDRSLAKVIQSGDVCHVVEQATRVIRGEAQRLVTGMVACWPGGGTQDLDNPARLVRMYYGWTCDDDGPTIDDLPFHTSERRWATQKAFTAAVRASLPPGGAAAPFAPSDHQGHWQKWLAAAGVDLDQVRFQTVMNASEGGVDQVMRFADSDAFVQWLIGATMPTSAVDQVSTSIETLRDKAAARPRWEDELALCRQVTEPLLELAVAHEKLERDRHELTKARGAGALVVADAQTTGEALQTRSQAEKLRADKHDKARRDAGALSRRAQAHRLRMQLRAAQLKADAAEQFSERRRADYQGTLRVFDAWQCVEHVLVAGEARARIAELTEQIEAAEQESGPLRQREGELRRMLARLLTAQRDKASQGFKAATTELREAEESVKALGDEIEQLVSELAAADEKVRALRAQISDADDVIAEAVHDGLLPEGAEPATVDDETRAQLRRARGERKSAVDAIQELDTLLGRDRAALTKQQRREDEARSEFTAATAALNSIEDRVRTITSDGRLLDSAGSVIDLWTQRGHLADSLRQTADAADLAVQKATTAATAAQRVLDSVGADGLLPPPMLAEHCARLCQEQDIPAWPGWRWLADTMTPAKVEAFASARPDIASGVVVAQGGDLVARAVEVIGTPRLDVALWVGAVTDPDAAMVAADTGGTDARVILPLAGTYDRDAAAEMVHDATESLTQAKREHDAAERNGRSTREVLANLGQLWREFPEDPRPALREKIVQAEQRRADAEAAAGGIGETIARREHQREERERDITAADELIEAFSDRLLRLAPVLLAARAGAFARNSLPAQRDAADEIRRHLEEMRPRRMLLAESLPGIDGRRSAHKIARDDAVQALREAGLVATTDGPVPIEDKKTIEGRLAGVRAAIEEATLDPGVESALTRERQRLADEESLIGTDEDVRALAQEYVASDAARHPVAIRSAIRDAATAKDAAQVALAIAAQAAESARSEHQKRVADTIDRSSPDVEGVPSAPTVMSESDAERLVRQLDDTATASLETQRREEGLAEQAKRNADGLTQELQLLQATVNPLLYLKEPDVTGRIVDDPRELMSRINTIVGRVRDAQAAVQDAQESRGRVTNRVRAIANSPLARNVEDRKDPRIVDLILRLRGDEQLPVDAERIAGHLEQRAASLADDLAHHDQEVRNCAVMLHVQAERAIQRLRAYQNQSRLPDGLGDWSDRQFVDISYPPLPTDESVAVDRVARIVHAQLTPGTGRSDARTMLFAAARALVDGSFRVRLLKPHTDLAVQRVDVAELKNFSGGQRVTAGVLLYATMTKVRASGRDAASIGWLWLDNPFGQASADQFVRTMRLVSDRLGLQLVFTAAPKDKGALSMFDRVIVLNKRSRPTSGEKVIVADKRREIVDLTLIQYDVLAVLGE